MPDFCAAYGCSNQRNDKTKQQGITFHRFPNDKVRRQAWTAALRRKGFEPQSRTVICSCHFKPEDFDRTGQTTRLKEGAIPSVFKFPDRLSKKIQKGSCRMSTSTCQRTWRTRPQPGVSSCRMSTSTCQRTWRTRPQPGDHHYAFDPAKAKHNIAEAQEQLEKLQRELRNAKDREKRHHNRVKTLLQDLKDKEILTEELQQKLDYYSGWLTWPCCRPSVENLR
uniref:THAP domain-containing protein 6-like n=1 Tax=Paramormyrops kingsleyae TaxID=1676925 RepID=A0A3B3R017_9TELE